MPARVVSSYVRDDADADPFQRDAETSHVADPALRAEIDALR
jgi:hypothetical protein